MIYHKIVEKVKNKTASGKVVVAGCSFRGYHSANFSFRNLGYVRQLFSLGRIFNIKIFRDAFCKDDVYNNNPEDYLQGIEDNQFWNIAYDANLKLSKVLSKKTYRIGKILGKTNSMTGLYGKR